jgi:HSP20 family protein
MNAPFHYYGMPLNNLSSHFRSLVSELLNEKTDVGCQNQVFPFCNLEWNEETVLLTFEAPGVAKEDLDVQLQGDSLIVSGERKKNYEGTLLRSESIDGKFSRTIRLPFIVENEAKKAELKNGILTLVLERKADTKPKKISINSL